MSETYIPKYFIRSLCKNVPQLLMILITYGHVIPENNTSRMRLRKLPQHKTFELDNYRVRALKAAVSHTSKPSSPPNTRQDYDLQVSTLTLHFPAPKPSIFIGQKKSYTSYPAIIIPGSFAINNYPGRAHARASRVTVQPGCIKTRKTSAKRRGKKRKILIRERAS